MAVVLRLDRGLSRVKGFGLRELVLQEDIIKV